MKRLVAPLILGLALAVPAWAEMHHMDHGSAAGKAAMAGPLSDGLVKKVDKAQGKLTLRHGPLVNLDMPPMTMVFRVTDPAWLDQLKPGDKIRFRADQVDGVLTVTRLDKVN